MLEIFYNDLQPKAQKEVLDYYGINSPEEANLDAIPLFIIEWNEDFPLFRNRNDEEESEDFKQHASLFS